MKRVDHAFVIQGRSAMPLRNFWVSTDLWGFRRDHSTAPDYLDLEHLLFESDPDSFR